MGTEAFVSLESLERLSESLDYLTPGNLHQGMTPIPHDLDLPN